MWYKREWRVRDREADNRESECGDARSEDDVPTLIDEGGKGMKGGYVRGDDELQELSSALLAEVAMSIDLSKGFICIMGE